MIRVECHSEFTYAEKPTALVWEGERLVIAEVLRQWRSPEGRHFRVRTEDGRVFELFYDEANDEWHAHPL
ncbi:MAG: hypothetical protein D6770_11380 [Anaerolineae bacterium]|nr:MAG: hypothetical protein D6770_11380 [Anaerolineae bacterium]